MLQGSRSSKIGEPSLGESNLPICSLPQKEWISSHDDRLRGGRLGVLHWFVIG